MQQWHWFRHVSNSIVVLFFGIMAYVIFIAFSRQSGSTGLDMGSIQQMRYNAQMSFQDTQKIAPPK